MTERAGNLRLATYNVEWFNALFDDDGQVQEDSAPSARHDTSRAQQLGALGRVFAALDADGIMIIEAPDTSRSLGRSSTRALESFAARFGLRTSRAITGFASDTEQEISFLYDPAVLSVIHDPEGTDLVPRFDHVHRQDLDGDGVAEAIQFSKPPLELAVTFAGRALRLIGVHTKSKSPRGAKTPAEVRKLSIENRRKLLAECLWIRLRAEAHLRRGDALIVMGDLNDGPGLDDYEKLFGKSAIEVVLAPDAAEDLQLYDPHGAQVLSAEKDGQISTARFWIAPKQEYFEALLDYIMVSPDLRAQAHWRIWHPVNDAECAADSALRDALFQASDHFPVTVDLDLAPIRLLPGL